MLIKVVIDGTVNKLSKAFSKSLRNKVQAHCSTPTCKPDFVDLDTVPDKPSITDKWACGLSKKDESIILNGEWLTDKIIIAAQGLIKKAYPSVLGFQNTNLGETLTFNVMKSEFVQVLHTGHCHWITISTIGCTNGNVNIYDSLYPALTTKLKNQIASLLCYEKKEITVKYKQMNNYYYFMIIFLL